MKIKKSALSAKGCLPMILGTVLVVVGMVLFSVITEAVTSAVIQARYGHTAAYALLTASTPCTVVCFVLLEAIFFLQYIPGEAPGQHASAEEVAAKKKKNKKIVLLISLGLLVAIVACGFVSANTYTVVSDDGISTVFFTETQHYDWEDVKRYTVSCDSKQGLSVTYIMTDFEQFEVLQGSAITTERFDQEHKNPVAFAYHVDQMLQERKIPKRTPLRQDTTIIFYEDRPDERMYAYGLIGYNPLGSSGNKTESSTTTTPAQPETTVAEEASIG